MTPFIAQLLAGGSSYHAKRSGLSVVVKPTSGSEAVLQAFQSIAEQILDNDGDGYDLAIRPHQTSDHAMDYYDMLVLTLHD
ncbi:hypothetical protein [Novosphingobium humi]|uniref:hypothetical protein n=1 Tax=Novosphingobium humi TaxID=2282397 RepID=UPI0025B100D1|nr:hypothetical protein [Novosphingobium humi]WJS97227.1 hypothetical protein NYQ05_08585 [Novosphingobium humi]